MSSKFGLETKLKSTSSIFGLKSWFHDQKEINSSLSDLVQERGFNFFSPEGITSYLTFRYPIGDLTMFQKTKRVPAGSELILGNVDQYWHPFFPERRINFADAEITVEQMLLAIIRTYANEKIAIPLSGGLDSSLLVALYRDLFPNKDIHTYTIGFKPFNEFKYAKIVAEQFDTIHKEIILTKDDFLSNGLLNSLILFKAEPLHPNELPLAIAERMAKKDGCTAVMCGEGGDDLFGGYSYNLCMYLNYANVNFVTLIGIFLEKYRYFSLQDRNKIIHSDYIVNDYSLLMKYLSQDEIPHSIRNWIFYFIQKIHTVGLITRGGNAIRYNDLIPLFPYINLQLVNFVNSLPFNYKIYWKELPNVLNYKTIADNHSIPKYLLKKVAEAYLPEEIVYREKVPFPVPFDNFLRNVNEWELDEEIFLSTDISSFNGWKKFMLINLNEFIQLFRPYKQKV